MQFIKKEIEGVWLIVPVRHGDHRGYFSEVYKPELLQEHIGPVNWVQENESQSTFGVLRGLHFQRGEWSQAKLVRVSRGKVLDVVVDLRGDSPTFGQHVAVELTAERGEQLFVPRGMAHGFVVLSDIAQFQYKVDNVYMPSAEMTLRYDDPALGIDWRLDHSQLLLSPKDLTGVPLADITPF